MQPLNYLLIIQDGIRSLFILGRQKDYMKTQPQFQLNLKITRTG